MLHAHACGALELRRGEAASGRYQLRGAFPYGAVAVLSDGSRTGKPLKETIASRAFGERVDDQQADIHLLAGHDFGRPLASRKAGTLRLRDTDATLEFEATIPDSVANTTHGRDALALIEAGLAVGLSPGFRLAPGRDAEMIEDRGDGILRTVRRAQLFELSIVTMPAYDQAQVEMRSWTQTTGFSATRCLGLGVLRWR